MKYASRNDALEFARRTQSNLNHIETAFNSGKDVHVITQLANSFLGLIVFPWERNFVEYLKAQSLDDLVKKGWPRFEVTKGNCDTLHDLIHHLRNAVAHGHMKFSSDSRKINEIAIEVEDYKPHSSTAYWRAGIEAKDLREFCRRFIDLLEDIIG